MAWTGNPCENESFFRMLKYEEVYLCELVNNLKQPFSFQADVVLTADDDVVQDIYAHNLPGPG